MTPTKTKLDAALVVRVANAASLTPEALHYIIALANPLVLDIYDDAEDILERNDLQLYEAVRTAGRAANQIINMCTIVDMMALKITGDAA